MPIAAAAITGAAAVYAAHKQSSSNDKATKAQVDAANQSAQLQGQSNAEALAYEREQAAEDKRRYDEAQQRNYEQYLRRYKAAQSLGKTINFDLPDAPDYYMQGRGANISGPAGGPTISAVRGSGAPNAPNAPGGGGIPKSTGNLEQDLALANQIAYGGKGHVDPNYWRQAGYDKDPQYFFQKMLGMDAGGKDKPLAGPYAGQAGAAPAGPMASRGVTAYLDPRLGGGGAPSSYAPAAAPDFRLRSIYANL